MLNKERDVTEKTSLLSSFLILIFIVVFTFNCVYAALSSSISISGMVVDKYSAKPVRNALIKCDEIQFRTTGRGCFFLPPMSYRPTQIIVSHKDYCSESVLVPAMSTIHGMVISLEPLNSSNISAGLVASATAPKQIKNSSLKDGIQRDDASIIDLVEAQNLRLNGIEKSVVKSVRKNLFTRLKAERFQRRKELMKNWFPTDDIWWGEFEVRRKKEKLAKKKRLEIARQKYYDYLRKSMYTEDLDTFITRLARERISNNATYSGIPEKYKLLKRDYKTYQHFEKLKIADFINDYQKKCSIISYNFGMNPRDFDLYDPQKVDLGYGVSLTGRVNGVYTAFETKNKTDLRKKTLLIEKDENQLDLKAIKVNGTIIDQETNRPLKDVVIMISEIHGSYRNSFFSGEKGFFNFECNVPLGDYIIEFYLPFYKYYSKSLNIRSESDFKLSIILEKGE